MKYSGGHISCHELFLAGNKGKHQNLVPSMLLNYFVIDLDRNEAKKNCLKDFCPASKKMSNQKK